MNRIDHLYRDHPDAEGFARGYLDYLAAVMKRLDGGQVAAFVRVLLEARERGAQLFFIGNGGSAATANHFANDLALGTRSARAPFRATSLTSNEAVLTCIANDFGYEEVFARQLGALMVPGDVVVAISASGNSPNLLRAVEYARAHGGVTVGITGFDGGRLREMVEVPVHVPTGRGEYGPAEDAHMILDHLVGAYLAQVCRAEVEAP